MSENIKTISKWSRRNRALFIVLVCITLVVIPQFVYVFLQAHAASHAFTTFSQALVVKDYQRAYSLTSPEFQSATNEQTFINQQESICSDLGGIEKITKDWYETENYSDGWSSDISARFICKQAERQVDFAMKKRGKIWKVYGYRER
ncbi:MAG: hypothetical protein ABSE27_13230 [Acidobacteriaceae bacterium]